MITRLLFGVMCAFAAPIVTLAIAFLIATQMGNDAGSALLMGTFFYIVPFSVIAGFALGVVVAK